MSTELTLLLSTLFILFIGFIIGWKQRDEELSKEIYYRAKHLKYIKEMFGKEYAFIDYVEWKKLNKED